MSDAYRLPTNVAPTHYELAIKTDLEATPAAYSGEAIIFLKVQNDTSKLVFNLDPSLTLTDIRLKTDSGATSTQVPTSALSVDEEVQRGHLDLTNSPLKAGTDAKLFLRWEAPIGTNMSGYYISEGDADEKTGKRPT